MRYTHQLLATLVLQTILLASMRPLFSAENDQEAPPAGSLKLVNTASDLVRLGIAPENLRPNDPAQDAGPLLEKALVYASQKAIPVVALEEKGDYFFHAREGTRAHVTVDRIQNVILEGNGARFHLRSRNMSGISILNSSHVGVQNLIIDYDQDLPFTTVVVKSVDVASGTVYFSKVLGRPLSELDNLNARKGIRIHVMREDGRGRVSNLLHRFFAARDVKFTDDQIKLRDGLIPADPDLFTTGLAQIRPGDMLSISERSLDGVNALEFSTRQPNLCRGNFAKEIKVYSSPAVGVAALWQRDIAFSEITVLPDPKRVKSQFISANADAVNNTNGSGNYRVENCTIALSGDDGISLSTGQLGVVNSIRKDGRVVVDEVRSPFMEGQRLLFSDPRTQGILASAVVKEATPPTQVRISESSQKLANSGDVPPKQASGKTSKQVVLVVDHDLSSVAPGAIVFMGEEPGTSESKPDIIIRKNSLYGIFARGIFFSGIRHAAIQSNTIQRTVGPGILGVASNELTGFRSPGNRDIVIEDNSVIDAFYWGVYGMKGAIQISITNLGNKTDAILNSNIRILNNKVSFENCSGLHWGIVMTHTADGVVDGNQINVLENGLPAPELQARFRELVE